MISQQFSVIQEWFNSPCFLFVCLFLFLDFYGGEMVHGEGIQLPKKLLKVLTRCFFFISLSRQEQTERKAEFILTLLVYKLGRIW